MNVDIEVVRKEWIHFLQEHPLENGNERVLKLLAKPLKVEEDQELFYLEPEWEERLFKALLGDYRAKRVCRYTSLESIFRTCNEKRQTMCNIVCMNDKSEGQFVAQQYPQLNWLLDSDKTEEYFIMSCTELDNMDNLDMWRLYGNNAQGVCVSYIIDASKYTPDGDFYIAPISYCDENGKNSILDFLAYIVNYRDSSDKQFALMQLRIWQHFFKPFEYKTEKEVRLLYDNTWRKKEVSWILDSYSGVITPMVSFSVEEEKNEFPLVIDETILGPKCISSDINIKQLNLIHEKNKIFTRGGGIYRISKSKIKHYR